MALQGAGEEEVAVVGGKYEELYRQLNSQQREAVDAIDGPVMVIAGPGTGKTNILTLRIAAILARTDTPPEAVLAITFTEAGASEMKRRLSDIIGPDAHRISITTFHAFCNNVIMEHPESLGALAGASSITEAEQAVIVEQLILETNGIELLRPANAPDLYLKAVLRAISVLKQEGVRPEHLRETADKLEKSLRAEDDLIYTSGVHEGKMKGKYQDELKQFAKLRECALLYTRYQEHLRAERLYDYADMVMEVARVLESDENLRLILQEQYLYILVDEHQDTNNAQNRVIELLASYFERPNLFVVGDARQAIYRFQGASLENFLYFKSRYPEVKLVELRHNYRSSQLLLDAAHGISPAKGGALEAKMSLTDTPIMVLPLSSPDTQYYTVARHISERIKSGVRPEEIAVLSRDNADAVAVSEFLRKLAVPFSLSTQQDFFSDPYLHQLLRILDAVRNFGASGPLLIALHTPTLGIEPLDVYKLTEFCRSGRNPYDVMRSPALMHEAGIDNSKQMSAVAALLSSWSRLAMQPDAAGALEIIVRESGILSGIVGDADAPDVLARLHTLYDMLRSRIQRDRTITLTQFAEHLDFLRDRGIALSVSTASPLPGRVRVMTAHKCKGLEFDYVYIIDAVEGHWGARTKRELIRLPPELFSLTKKDAHPEEATDDERNLFYVALTRARKEVVITYSQRTIEGSELLPSRYIADIKPTLLKYADTTAAEKAWTNEGSIRYAQEPPREPQSADKAYLNELFARQGLSVSALNNYLTCPWRYFYTSLLRIPEAPVFAIMFGNAVDRALQEYFDRYVAGTIPSRDDLVELFEGFIRHQPLQQLLLDEALKRGRTALEGYYDCYHTTWHPNIINQLKIPAIELDSGILITGRIDKMELTDGSGTVVVTDYKTGKPKSRNQISGAVKDGDGNYLRQLTFYKLLLDRWQKGRYRMSIGIIDFIEPDIRGKWHREEFTIEPSAVEELKTLILRVAGEIRALSFWNTHCNEPGCPYCALRNLMTQKSPRV